MSWTLTLSLILPAIVFVAFMHQTIQKIKKSAFVYPSEAIIDQSLPPEILEEVLMNLDYKTILACSSVSKYWCYHANKKQIRDLVFSKIGQSRATVEELQSDLKDRTYDLSTFKWLDYPKDYSPQWHIEDKLVADRLKKTIIDADSASLVKLKVALGAPAYGPYHNAGNAAHYLAKMRLEASHLNDKDWLFRNNDSNYFTVPKETVPPHWHFNPGSTVEVIADLPYVQQHYSQFPNFYSYRTMDASPKLAGLIRLNTNILYILFFWYTPCILVDYWANTNPNKFWVDLIIGLIGAAGQAFIATIVLWDGISDVNNRKRAAAIFIPTILIIIGLLFIFSVWAREVFYLTSLAAGCFIYAGLTNDYYKKGGFEFRMFVLFTAYCMVVSMNDWRLTVDAFRSSEIWFTFLKNFLLYLVVVIYAIVINFLRHCVQNWKLDVPALIRWEKNTIEFLALNTISIIFISLYGPVTTRFIKEAY